jgi:CheY-like chemotaxis protein
VRRQILAVDDEPEILAIFRERLQARYDVHTATFATEAVRRLETVRPELILLDINMPGVDGLALLQFLKSRRMDTPVIVITANPSNKVSQACLEHGAFAYCPKPLNMTYLDHLVAAALGA